MSSCLKNEVKEHKRTVRTKERKTFKLNGHKFRNSVPTAPTSAMKRTQKANTRTHYIKTETLSIVHAFIIKHSREEEEEKKQHYIKCMFTSI